MVGLDLVELREQGAADVAAEMNVGLTEIVFEHVGDHGGGRRLPRRAGDPDDVLPRHAALMLQGMECQGDLRRERYPRRRRRPGKAIRLGIDHRVHNDRVTGRKVTDVMPPQPQRHRAVIDKVLNLRQRVGEVVFIRQIRQHHIKTTRTPR